MKLSTYKGELVEVTDHCNIKGIEYCQVYTVESGHNLGWLRKDEMEFVADTSYAETSTKEDADFLAACGISSD